MVGRDDQGVSVGSSQGSVIPQQLNKFDTVKAIEQLAPRIFEGMTVEEKIQYIKDNFISFSVTTRAKASSPNNKNLKVGIFLESTDSYTTKFKVTLQNSPISLLKSMIAILLIQKAL